MDWPSVNNAADYALQQCTWYVAQVTSWIPGGLGDAADWAKNIQKIGYSGSSDTVQEEQGGPVLYSVSDWGRGVDGASKSDGHVAKVTGFAGNGLPIVSEMNWTYPTINGSGTVDQRTLTPAQSKDATYILPPAYTGNANNIGNYNTGGTNNQLDSSGGNSNPLAGLGTMFLLIVVGCATIAFGLFRLSGGSVGGEIDKAKGAAVMAAAV